MRHSKDHFTYMIEKTTLLIISFILFLPASCSSPAQVSTPSTIHETAPIPPTPTQPAQLETPGLADFLPTDQKQTLASLELVNDYPLYTMVYKGAYSSTSNHSTGTVGESVMLPTSRQERPFPWACSLFAALADPDQMLFGRNFDWEFSPALLLFTDPPDGYASVSMVDITYLGFDPSKFDTLMSLPIEERTALLNAPSWPFDGMNEHGLAIGMAAVPTGFVPDDPNKQTIGSIGIIRQVLDYAADIEQAVDIIKSHNINFRGGPGLHYLLADASGKSILVEFYDGEVRTISADKPWHQTTNFIVSAFDNPQGQCGRYNKIAETLDAAQGRLSTEDAFDLLSRVAQPSTQWSIIYRLENREIAVVMGREYDSPNKFQLK